MEYFFLRMKTGDPIFRTHHAVSYTHLSPDGNGEVIDQDAVNGFVDYAIAHGVNYFDTSTAYVQGFSEKATGIALSRHPRDKYFIATKLSNFSPGTWSREASLRMQHKSCTELQVDYIDYMLLHGIGMGGMDALKGRYLDNGFTGNNSFSEILKINQHMLMFP